MPHGKLTDDRNQFDAFVIRDLGGEKSAFAALTGDRACARLRCDADDRDDGDAVVDRGGSVAASMAAR
jgi:hypothetical protein